MKKFKQGFSLAELLICMAIIAIVAVMGTTIAKKGSERAFNQYIYTGYDALSKAFADAFNNGYEFNNTTENDEPFFKHIANLLSAQISFENNAYKLSAPNNIMYTFKTYTGVGGFDLLYSIKMEVPTVKKEVVIDGNKTTITKDVICLTFARKNMQHIFIDSDGISYCKPTIKNLQDRKDLLTFYIDDGVSGRVIIPVVNDDGEFQTEPNYYNKREFLSFKEAICKLYGNKYINGGFVYNGTSPSGSLRLGYSCSNDEPDPNKNYKNAVLRYINPRKVF